ncbi:MAG: NAD-dependent deacylase [Bacteroidota bacterium]
MAVKLEVSDRLGTILRKTESVCVLTGAGVSAESGVPTFRGDDGLWKKFRPEELANFGSFMKNPDLVWEWYLYRRRLINEVRPNAGHSALAQMQDIVQDFTLVTQNVDNLHARAGSRNVVELHGNIMRSYCLECGLFAGEGTQKPLIGVPRCEHCGGMLRPDVVWFGELLPQGAFQKAVEAAQRCDLFLLVGTSGIVYPAASIPGIAREAGAFVVEINPEYTDLSPGMSETLLGPSGAILPDLLSIMKEYHDHQQN